MQPGHKGFAGGQRVYGQQGVGHSLLEKPQVFFWSPEGICTLRESFCDISGFDRRKKNLGEEGKKPV